MLNITLKSIGDAVICTDETGTINFMNPIAEKLTGYTLEESLGRHISECFHIINVFTREKVNNPVLKVIESGNIVGLANHTLLISKTGDEYHISDSGAPIISPNGELLGVVLVFRDVTDQYHAEERLLESERRFRSLFENMKEGVALHELILDASGKPVNYCLIDTNPAYQLHTGIHLPHGERRYANEMYNTDTPPYLDEFAKVAITGETFVFDTYFEPLGRHFHVSVISTRKNTFATIFEDITERIKMLNALQESEQRFRKIFEDSADAIVLIKKGMIVDCNKAALKLLKFKTKKLLVGKTPQEISPEFQNNGIESSVKAIDMMNIAYEHGKNRFEWTHKCSDDSLVECEIMLTSMRGEGENMLHAVMRDITLRNQALRRLTESEEKFRTLFETMVQGVIYYTPDGVMISANSAAEKIFETNKLLNYKNALEFRKWQLIDLEGNLIETDERPEKHIIQSQQELRNIKIGIKSDIISVVKWLNINVIPVVDKTTNSIINIYVTFEDISELIEIEKALTLAKTKAEQSDKLKTAFLANLSHEIRTPMNAIMGFSELLMGQTLHESSRKYYAEIINNSSRNLLRIIDDLLDISKIESGQLNLDISPVDINHLLEKTYSVFNQILHTRKHKDLELKMVSAQQELIAMADETRLQQILNNLIENAIKFTEAGSIEFGCSIENGFLHFWVSDTGIGIAPELQHKVFERFWQADDSRVKSKGGTGLGLSICLRLVEIMGGSMGFVSAEAKGSRFYFSIPYNEALITNTKNKTIESSNKKHSILKLLVVEDDLINVQYLKEILSRYKTCEFEFAYDGIEAIEKCRNNNYHIMLLDIQLPGMNGFEVARKIREFNKKITIIAQTAFAMAEDKTKCIAAGCNNYISKPINYLELFSMLDSYNTGSQ